MKKITINEKTKRVVTICTCVLLCVTLAAVSFFGGWVVHKKTVEEYSVSAVVTDIVAEKNSVYFTTPTEHTFVIITDEIFSINENYTLTFTTNNTPTIEDDEIIRVARDIFIY